MTSRARSALVVDGDASYRGVLKDGLTGAGYAVSFAPDVRRGLRAFEDKHPDIVLLDVRLPDGSGIELCKELRRRSDIPIIMVSAVAEELDIVLCFELGADDYVPKPFRLRELVARMDSAIRHWERGRRAAGRPTRDVESVEVGPYRIDFLARTVEVEGRFIELPQLEFDLLAHLALVPGRVCTREELMSDVWHKSAVDGPADDRTLDTHMYRLRTKLEKDPAHPKWIVTVRGVGYLLNDGRRGVAESETDERGAVELSRNGR
ncbi:MAG: response regulator transcription factor [Acidimicrobiales bacterium]